MDKRETLADLMLAIFPLVHRKLFKDVKMHQFGKGEFMLLNKMLHDNGLTMSEYGEQLVISKPNLTKVVIGLEKGLLLEKVKDASDKRVTRLMITEKGKKVLKDNYDIMKGQVAESLVGLSDEDINQLIESFETSRVILSKLQDIRK